MEQQADYTTEIKEALDMMGKGYDEVRVKDESNDHKYFTITPRIVKAYARNPHDLALWETIKDIAGESGECYLNTEQLAILGGMSAGQVSNSRKYWLKIGFLKGEIRKDPGYSQGVWHLSIPDLWAKNIEWCEKHPKIEDRLKFRVQHKSLHRMKASPPEAKPSPTETKKILTKKNIIGVPPMPIDWQVGHDQPLTPLEEKEQFEREARDRANLIEFQCAGAGALAYAFMIERGLLLPESTVKGHRKAAREMMEAGVKPEHVTEATRQLKNKRDRDGKPLTIVDLFGVKKTAISLANMVSDFVATLDGSALERLEAQG